MLHPQCHQERSPTGEDVLTEWPYAKVHGSLSIPWSQTPKWSEIESSHHQCNQQITRHCVRTFWPMSSWSERLRLLHPSEAPFRVCLSCMGPSLHQGCEEAWRYTNESSKIHHWKQGKDWRNCYTDLGRLGLPHPPPPSPSRDWGKRIIPVSTSTANYYKYSFWPNTFTDWNAIPPRHHTEWVVFL